MAASYARRPPLDMKASLARVAAGGIPLRAAERLAEEAGDNRRLFTSDLSVNEFLLARDAGCQPIAQVMGSSIYHIGQIPDYKGKTAELTVISDAHRESRRLAIQRIAQEAALVGADAVIGAHLRDRMITMGSRGKGGDDGGEVIEFTVVGTAVKAPFIVHPPGQPVVTDLSGQDLRAHVAPLADLKAKQGVYFVTGNHEYYSGVDSWLAELVRLGIRPLRNERVELKRGADTIDLAGVDDWTARGFGHGHGPDLPRALEGRDATRPLILLAHQPKQIVEAAKLGVGLQLSGHTHGGQIFPFNFLVKLQQPYVAGLHRHQDSLVYVSCGTGYWGPPMRVGIPSEITLLTLRPA